MFRKGLGEKVNDTKICNEGRYVALGVTINDTKYKLANYYGPNSDDTKFIHELMAAVENIEGDHTILGGDFNLVMNLEMDKKGGNWTTNFKCRSALKTWRTVDLRIFGG